MVSQMHYVSRSGTSLHRFDLDHSRKEMRMKNFMTRLWKEEEGQDLTEYALLLVLIALAAIVVMSNLGSAINVVFSKGASALTSAT
jgi:Flp pilus assembly pilin Flp